MLDAITEGIKARLIAEIDAEAKTSGPLFNAELHEKLVAATSNEEIKQLLDPIRKKFDTMRELLERINQQERDKA